MFGKRKVLTLEKALSLNEIETKKNLTEILWRYIQERIKWVLHDLWSHVWWELQVTLNINTYVSKIIWWLSYDDAKEMLITLLESNRFSNTQDVSRTARRIIINMIEWAMAYMNLWRVHYSSKEKKRVLTTIK